MTVDLKGRKPEIIPLPDLGVEEFSLTA